MTYTLGYQTQHGVNVALGYGNDFVCNATRKDGSDYPGGATVTLLIGANGAIASWPATISGSIASWNVDYKIVNAIIAEYQNTQVPVSFAYHDTTGADFTLCDGRVTW